MRFILMIVTLTFVPEAMAFGLNHAFDFFIGSGKWRQEGVILDMGSHKVIKGPHVRPQDFAGVYFVRIPNLIDRHAAGILSSVDVLNYQEGIGAVVRFKNEGDSSTIASAAHELNNSCGAIIKLYDRSVKALRADPVPIHPVEVKKTIFETYATGISPEHIREESAHYTSFPNRFSTTEVGKAFSAYLKGRYLKLASKHRRPIQVDLIPSGEVGSQETVVVRILGSSKPDEIVILGSHIDNICFGCKDSPAAGEDDNASGTSANFEVFRNIVENNIQFERTLEIHGYAAEERGLMGSRAVATEYADQEKNVVAMLQNDMNLHNPNKLVRFLFDASGSRPLTKSLISLVENYLPTIEYRIGGIPGSSDHRSWIQTGVHAAFPFEDVYYTKIHTIKDNGNEHFDYDQAAVFSRLSLVFALHYAGGNIFPGFKSR